MSDELNDGMNENISSRDWTTTLLLSIFTGAIGGHRFYVGKMKSAVLMLLTGGGCGIWALLDIISVVTGKFTDAEGRVIPKK